MVTVQVWSHTLQEASTIPELKYYKVKDIKNNEMTNCILVIIPVPSGSVLVCGCLCVGSCLADMPSEILENIFQSPVLRSYLT